MCITLPVPKHAPSSVFETQSNTVLQTLLMAQVVEAERPLHGRKRNKVEAHLAAHMYAHALALTL